MQKNNQGLIIKDKGLINVTNSQQNNNSQSTCAFSQSSQSSLQFSQTTIHYHHTNMEVEDEICFKNKKPLNPQKAEEFIDDIFKHIREVEFELIPKIGYMKDKQKDINEKMRSILMDWLVEVHLKFGLLPETLFLTANIIDRYLEKEEILRSKLQLVGVSAMLIACKYEEIYAPEVKDFVYITDHAYTKNEVFQMENLILKKLEFNITTSSSLRFLEVYNHYIQLEENAFMFCRYLLELFLIEYKMLKYNPSLIAAATIFIVLKIAAKNKLYDITNLTGYSEEILKDCAKDICLVIDNAHKSSLKAVTKKFATKQYFEVSQIKLS